MMKLSVILPTNSRDTSIWPTISSCLEQDFHGFNFEILVVCNQPNFPLQDLERNLANKNLRVLCSNRIGVNYARNYGIEHSNGELLYFLDDDCLLPNKQFFSQLIELHNHHPETCVIGGTYQSNSQTNYWGHRYNEMVNYWIQSHNNESRQTLLPGGNCSFKKKLIGSHRFNPNIVYGGSETEFLLRLQKNGILVQFNPTLQIFHQSTPSLSLIIKKAWLQGKGRSRYLTPKGKISKPQDLTLEKIIFLSGYRAVVDSGAFAESILNKISTYNKKETYISQRHLP